METGEEKGWECSPDVALSGVQRRSPVMGREKDGGFSKFLLSQDCVEDVVSPIILRLNFSLVGDSSRNLRPVLAVGSQDHVTASVSSCPIESQR